MTPGRTIAPAGEDDDEDEDDDEGVYEDNDAYDGIEYDIDGENDDSVSCRFVQCLCHNDVSMISVVADSKGPGGTVPATTPTSTGFT